MGPGNDGDRPVHLYGTILKFEPNRTLSYREASRTFVPCQPRGADDPGYVLVEACSIIKKFIILDLIAGGSIYYIIKIISASVALAMLGSYFGTTGIKRLNLIH